MKRLSVWAVPGIPFLVSMALSLSTIDDRVSWQDSGFYLTAVYELSVLYPPGFVVYQVLCKSWTLLFFFLDFTLAVHLFSSACAALAAATLALAVRDLLTAREPLLRVTEGEPGAFAGWCGAAIGCLAASGYTFWYSGTMAKGYAFLYLMLTLLMWRMIRAAETKRPRDFTLVAVLIGLAWQAHPSATLTGLALVLFVLVHRHLLGWKGVGWRAAVAAGVALAPTLLLLVLARRDVYFSFGDPRSPGDLVEYVLGSRFTDKAGNWGWDPSRAASVGQFLWEEMLGVGLVLMVAGLVRIALANRRLFAGLMAWVVPLLVVTVSFTIEGQHDLWFVGAWIPLYLAGGVGLWTIVRKAGARAPVALGALVAVGLAWAVAANWPLLNKRGYDLPEHLGRVYLKALAPDAVVFLNGDDELAITRYLQIVREYRMDVLVLHETDLGTDLRGEPGHLYRRMMRRDSRLGELDFSSMKDKFPSASRQHVLAASFVQANFKSSRPIYMVKPPPMQMLPAECVVIPAGAAVKLAKKGADSVDLRYWEFEINPEEVLSRLRRKRGQRLTTLRNRQVRAVPQAYEERLLRALLQARLNLADFMMAERPQDAFRLYQEVRRFLPAIEEDDRFLMQWGRVNFLLGRLDEAEAAFRRFLALEAEVSPAAEQMARRALEDIARARKRPRGAEK